MKHLAHSWKSISGSSRLIPLIGLLFMLSGCRSLPETTTAQAPTRLPPAWTATPANPETGADTGVQTPEAPAASETVESYNPPLRSPAFISPPEFAEVGSAWQSTVDGATMLFIPAGGSFIGARSDFRFAEPDERPQNRIQLDAFWIAETEVTNTQYAACVREGSCRQPLYTGSATRSTYYDSDIHGDYPVIGINWYQARDYCAWIGGSLPTEAQWEKAARSHDGRNYPWEWIGAVYNNRSEIRLNYCDIECTLQWADRSYSDGFADTAPVGSFPAGASPYGVLDMAGNVWEWTNDWYSSESFKDMSLENPTGPEAGVEKVIKGGSWMDGLTTNVTLIFRSSNRAFRHPLQAYNDLGFRCILPAVPD